jgi:hypothetical protein
MNRRIATFVLTACYGAVALLGPELHELLGCHHHEHLVERPWAGGRSPSDSVPESATTGSPVDLSVDAADDEAGDDHDGCPLCKLLSMAQTTGLVDGPHWVVAGAPGRFSFSCGPVIPAPLSSCRIRAPPAIAG